MFSRTGQMINWSEPRGKEDENSVTKFATSYFWVYLIRLKTHREKRSLIWYCVLYHCWHSNTQCWFVLLTLWLCNHGNSVWLLKSVFLVLFFLSSSTFVLVILIIKKENQFIERKLRHRLAKNVILFKIITTFQSTWKCLWVQEHIQFWIKKTSPYLLDGMPRFYLYSWRALTWLFNDFWHW